MFINVHKALYVHMKYILEFKKGFWDESAIKWFCCSVYCICMMMFKLLIFKKKTKIPLSVSFSYFPFKLIANRRELTNADYNGNSNCLFLFKLSTNSFGVRALAYDMKSLIVCGFRSALKQKAFAASQSLSWPIFDRSAMRQADWGMSSIFYDFPYFHRILLILFFIHFLLLIFFFENLIYPF